MKFQRNNYVDHLTPDQEGRIIGEVKAFLDRRFQTLAEGFDSIEQTNFNPWLLLITAPVYNLFSPFELAERVQLGKAFHGDDTAFGRMAEEKFLAVFGAVPPSEKIEMGQRWTPVDLSIMIEGTRYLLSVKSGPWTMNQEHANAMSDKFPAIHEQTGARIVLGILYGRREHLNNKPALVNSRLGNPEWFDFMVGKDFWEFISGVRDVHKHIFSAIRKGQTEFAREHNDETFHEKLVGNRIKLAASIRKKFDVEEEEDFWETLFNNMF